jgi:hypothetical protein
MTPDQILPHRGRGTADGGGGVQIARAVACWRDSANRFAKLPPQLLFAPLHREGAVPLPLWGRI